MNVNNENTTNMKRLYSLILLFFLVTIPTFMMAQPPGLPGDPDQAPIDGGLGILAALGGTYAIKKLRERNT